VTLLAQHDAVAELDAKLAAIAKERAELVAAMPAYDATQAGDSDRAAKIVNIQSRLGELDIAREKTVARRRMVISNLDHDVSAQAAKRERELLREVKAAVESATAELAELLADVRECRRGQHDIPTWNAELVPSAVVAAAIDGRSLVHPDPADLGADSWTFHRDR
jgi:hypothetical protein